MYTARTRTAGTAASPTKPHQGAAKLCPAVSAQPLAVGHTTTQLVRASHGSADSLSYTLHAPQGRWQGLLGYVDLIVVYVITAG